MQRYSLRRTARPVSKLARAHWWGWLWRAPSIILPDCSVLRVGERARGAVAQAREVVLIAAESLRRGLHLEGAKALVDHLRGSEKGGDVVSTAPVRLRDDVGPSSTCQMTSSCCMAHPPSPPVLAFAHVQRYMYWTIYVSAGGIYKGERENAFPEFEPQVAGSVLRLGIHTKARGFWFLNILFTTTLQYVTRTSGTEEEPQESHRRHA